MFRIALYKGTKLVGYVIKKDETGETCIYGSRWTAVNELVMLKRKFLLPEDYKLKTERVLK